MVGRTAAGDVCRCLGDTVARCLRCSGPPRSLRLRSWRKTRHPGAHCGKQRSLRLRQPLIVIVLMTLAVAVLLAPAAMAQPRGVASDPLALLAVQLAELTASYGAAKGHFDSPAVYKRLADALPETSPPDVFAVPVACVVAFSPQRGHCHAASRHRVSSVSVRRCDSMGAPRGQSNTGSITSKRVSRSQRQHLVGRRDPGIDWQRREPQ